MKQRDLKTCAICDRGVMHSGIPLFYRMKIQRFGVKVNAVRRQAGLEQFLGSGQLAAVMGPDEDIASPLTEEADVLVCEECSTQQHCVAYIAEVVMADES